LNKEQRLTRSKNDCSSVGRVEFLIIAQGSCMIKA
jgi:hypothetical protein